MHGLFSRVFAYDKSVELVQFLIFSRIVHSVTLEERASSIEPTLCSNETVKMGGDQAKREQ
jgi:hypothetical protein